MTLTNSPSGAAGGSGNQSEKQLFNMVFAAMVAAALALYGTGSLDPNDLRWLWIMGLAGISLLQMSSRAVVQEKISFDRLELSLVCFAAYAALSLAWSPDPLAGYIFLCKFGLLAVIFLCLKNAGNDAWFNGLCGAISVAAAIVLGMAFFKIGPPQGWGGYGNPNFITEFLLLAVPFIAIPAFIHPLKAVRAAAIAVIATDLGYLFFFNPSKIEFLVIGGLVFAAALGMGWRRSRWLAVGAALAVIVAVAAGVTYYWGADHGFRSSIYPRIGLVINTLLMWLDKPLFGQGAGSFNFMYALYQERHLAWLDVGAEIFVEKQTIAGAAHNEYAQLLSTFGLLGAALVGALAWFLLRGLRGRPMTPYAWGGLAVTGAWLFNALIEFPLQNPATGLLAAIGLGFLAHHGQSGPTEKTAVPESGALFVIELNQATKMLLLLASVALVGAAGYGGYRFDAGNRRFMEAVRNLGERPDYAYAQNYQAYLEYPWDTNIRSQLYVTTTRWFEVTGKPPMSPVELDQLFDISVKAMPNTQLMLARLQYLLNSQIYTKDERYMRELERGFGIVRKNASHTPDARVLDAYYRIVIRDYAGAAAELDAAEKLGLNSGQKSNVDKLRAALNARVSAGQTPQK